jgi:hypothetical protein
MLKTLSVMQACGKIGYSTFVLSRGIWKYVEYENITVISKSTHQYSQIQRVFEVRVQTIHENEINKSSTKLQMNSKVLFFFLCNSCCCFLLFTSKRKIQAFPCYLLVCFLLLILRSKHTITNHQSNQSYSNCFEGLDITS